MSKYTGLICRSVALLAAVTMGACRGDKPNGDTLAADTSLSRQLANAGRDTALQPQLRDIPSTPPPLPPSAEPTRRRRETPRAPRNQETPRTAPRSFPPPPITERTATGNIETHNPAGSAAAAAGGAVGTVPGGSTLALNSTSRVCTNTNAVGDRFTATVSDPVSGSNGTVIPAGATVDLTVTQLKKSSNSNEPVVMEFSVNSISFGGHTYPVDASVQTASVDRVRSSTKQQDLTKVGAGAVIGAIAGGLLGHSTKGAVIGGAVGAAGGAGVAAATGSYDGCIASGGRLVVRLNSGVQVKA